MAKVFIGTSGWVYKEWGKKFFPKDLPRAEHLKYLASRFNTVEINATFYRLQSATSFAKWRAATPRHFRFAVKVSRFITHIKRMKTVRGAWRLFLKSSRALQEKRGPFLFQFPSTFRGGDEQVRRIRDFLEATSSDGRFRMAFEFRHESCFSEAMLGALKKYRAALVFANSSKYPTAPFTATADFVYFRLHGPKRLFASSYSSRQLREYAVRIKRFLRQRKDVYVYFNNDMHANAPANAKLLQSMLG